MEKIKWLSRLTDKITCTDTPNNAAFDYYGHHVTMLSGTVDYTDVTIQSRDGRTILRFSLDFLTKECSIEHCESDDLRNTLVASLKSLYPRMAFNDL